MCHEPRGAAASCCSARCWPTCRTPGPCRSPASSYDAAAAERYGLDADPLRGPDRHRRRAAGRLRPGRHRRRVVLGCTCRTTRTTRRARRRRSRCCTGSRRCSTCRCRWPTCPSRPTSGRSGVRRDGREDAELARVRARAGGARRRRRDARRPPATDRPGVREVPAPAAAAAARAAPAAAASRAHAASRPADPPVRSGGQGWWKVSTVGPRPGRGRSWSGSARTRASVGATTAAPRLGVDRPGPRHRPRVGHVRGGPRARRPGRLVPAVDQVEAGVGGQPDDQVRVVVAAGCRRVAPASAELLGEVAPPRLARTAPSRPACRPDAAPGAASASVARDVGDQVQHVDQAGARDRAGAHRQAERVGRGDPAGQPLPSDRPSIGSDRSTPTMSRPSSASPADTVPVPTPTSSNGPRRRQQAGQHRRDAAGPVPVPPRVASYVAATRSNARTRPGHSSTPSSASTRSRTSRGRRRVPAAAGQRLVRPAGPPPPARRRVQVVGQPARAPGPAPARPPARWPAPPPAAIARSRPPPRPAWPAATPGRAGSARPAAPAVPPSGRRPSPAAWRPSTRLPRDLDIFSPSSPIIPACT